MLSGCGQTERSRPVCPRRFRRRMAGNARSPGPLPDTAIEPSVSVRSTAEPSDRNRASVPPAGWPYRFPEPTGTIARRGRIRSYRPGSWWALPWWATLTTSTGPSSGWFLSKACWEAGSRSPSRSRVRPALRTSRATLASLGPSGRGPAAGGHSTCHSSGPARRRSPSTAVTRGTRAACATRRTNSACPGGSSRPVACTTPTARPRSTPASPPTWSAWKCVSKSSGTRLTPSSLRHASTGPGSGPASTTTAVPGATARTAASPWPTAHCT